MQPTSQLQQPSWRRIAGRGLVAAVLALAGAVTLGWPSAGVARTGLATSETHPVYTWRLRGPDNQIVREYASEWSGNTENFRWRQDYVYAGWRLLASFGNGSDWQRDTLYYFADHLGSPRAILDASGALASRPTFLPYGEDVSDWRDEGALRFTSHERDFEHLDYMHARYYDGALQRFLSPDDAEDGWNTYAYAGNDPINQLDRSGLAAGSAAATVFVPGEGIVNSPGTFVRPGGGFVGGRPVGGRVLPFRAPASSLRLPPSAAARLSGSRHVHQLAFTVGWVIGETISDAETGVGTVGEVWSDAWSDALIANDDRPSTSSQQRYKRFVDFGGNKVFQQDQLIDPSRVDSEGRTSLELMDMGRAPIGPDGLPVVIHHLLQTAWGPLLEIAWSVHNRNHKLIHINTPDIPSGIDRNKFEAWRKRYWKWRANDFR